MKNQIRMLHLEDSRRDAQLIQDKLEAEGLSCEIVRVDSREQFEAALAGESFDVVLCDYNLPGYDGLSALKHAREKHPVTPVILISGSLGEEEAVKSLQLGATDYLLKQHLERFVPAVRRALEEAEEHQRRQQAEAELRESEERFRQLAEQSSEVFWFCALNPERIVYVSPAVEKVWGLPAERFYQDARAWMEAIHPGDRSRVLEIWQECLDGRSARIEAEYRVVRPDGSVRWVLDSGTTIRNEAGEIARLSGVARDITERKQAEMELRRTSVFRKAVIDRVREGLCVCHNIAEFPFVAFTVWNPRMTEITGCTMEEINRRGWYQTMYPDPEHQAKAKARLEAMREGDGLLGEESEITHANGQKRTVLFSTSVLGVEGSTVHVLALCFDITERKRTELQMLRTQRLESIGTLAGGVAHDLNNALAPILMSTQLLRMEFPDASQTIDIVEASAKRGADMVRQLLTFAKGIEGERVLIQSQYLFKEIGKIISATFPKNIELRTTCRHKLETILGDATQLHQVLLNLCVNARDAMPDGGTLTLEAENSEIDATYASAIPEAKPGPYVVWRVTDTGTGIPPELLDRIFEPFFSTKSPDKGTGLGLSTVMGIVKSHGGFVRVYSIPGQGSTFAVYLPAAESIESDASFLTKTEATLRGNGETILVVDDEPAVRQVARAVLTALNFTPVTAADGTEALILVAEKRADLRAVITDVHMPHMDGVSFVRVLKRMVPEAGIIVASGRLEEREEIEFMALGISARLDKPFTQEALVAALKTVFEK